MKRRLFIVAAFLSLLLCAASVVLAFHGYFYLGQLIDFSMGNGLRDGDAPEPWMLTSGWANMPLVTVTILTLIPPIFATRAIREETKLRRIRRGFCPTCSYNLTANTTGVCPECGTPTPRP